MPHGIKEILKRQLIFVNGKGGVGKTTLSGAIARHLAKSDLQGAEHSQRKTLLVTFQDPLSPDGLHTKDCFWHLNAQPQMVFEEYIQKQLAGSVQWSVEDYLKKTLPDIAEKLLREEIHKLLSNPPQ